MGMLHELFGTCYEEIWQQFQKEVGGQFQKGKFGVSAVVRVQVRNWTVTLDVDNKGKEKFTRFRAPYINKDGFRFKIFNRNLFTDIGKYFGMQDLTVGGPRLQTPGPIFGVPSYISPTLIDSVSTNFDRDYIIQANNVEKVKMLFSQVHIRDLFDAKMDLLMEVKDDEGWFGANFPQGVDELYFIVHGVLKDVERLKLCFELFSSVLHLLCHMGSAYEGDPKLQF